MARRVLGICWIAATVPYCRAALRVCTTSIEGFSQPNEVDLEHPGPHNATLDDLATENLTGWDLWRLIASDTGHPTWIAMTFPTFPSLVYAVSQRWCDLGFGSLILNAGRETCLCGAPPDGTPLENITNAEACCVDHTLPYLSGGYVLLQSRERMAAKSRTLLGLVWNAIIDFRTVNAFSWVFTAIVGMGVLLWVIERGFNEDEFRKPLFHGLSDGIWWAAVTATTVGYGDKLPRSPLGRLIGLLWMFSSLLIVGTFAGIMTTAFVENSRADIAVSPGEFEGEVIATFDGVGPALLSEYEVTPLVVRSVREALSALDDERAIAAMMEMAMVLNFRKRDPGALDDYVVSPSFRSVQYSFVLQQGSPYLRAFNEALLESQSNDESQWRSILLEHFGVDTMNDATVGADDPGRLVSAESLERVPFSIMFACLGCYLVASVRQFFRQRAKRLRRKKAEAQAGRGSVGSKRAKPLATRIRTFLVGEQSGGASDSDWAAAGHGFGDEDRAMLDKGRGLEDSNPSSDGGLGPVDHRVLAQAAELLGIIERNLARPA